MYHDLLHDASFWTFLFSIDQDLAETVRKQGCPCGGCLHRANYPRKPRGGGKGLPESYRHRLSFCCASDGCRKHATPPSVRFLGRKVYLHAVVILVAAMRQLTTTSNANTLKQPTDVPLRKNGTEKRPPVLGVDGPSQHARPRRLSRSNVHRLPCSLSGRQPTTSYRSDSNSPLPLVAEFCAREQAFCR